MSRETLQHLNTNTLIGTPHARGRGWHNREEQQGSESNHYPGPIPIEDVERRLFHWQAQSRRIAIETPADLETMSHLSDDGKPTRWAVLADRQAISRSDDAIGKAMGIFKPGYA